MLMFCRPYASRTEQAFVDIYVASLPGAARDAYGNYHVRIGDSPIIWSCHTDTVHRHGGMQTIHYDPLTTIMALSKRSKRNGRNCLGADDTAGVFLCCEMVRAGVPGHYIFHRGEEVGGLGSSALAYHAPELLGDAQFAIAFDRRGIGDIITHQWVGRCASDRFAASLSDALHEIDSSLQYLPARGSYTDTAEYTGLVPECSNLSIGYFHEHTPDEMLLSAHTFALLAALCRLDQSALVAQRTPRPSSCADWSDWGWYDGFEYIDPGLPVQRSDCSLDPLHAKVQAALRRQPMDVWPIGRRI